MTFPSSLTTVTVAESFVSSPGGVPLSGRLQITSAVWLQGPAADPMVQPVNLSIDLDETGSISVALPVNDDPQWSPAGWPYTVSGRLGGRRLSGTFELTTALGPTVSLSSILNQSAPDEPSFYIPTSALGQPGGPAQLDALGLLPVSSVNDLQTQLDGLQPAGEYLTAADVADLVSYETLGEELAGKVSTAGTDPQSIASNLTVDGVFRVGASGTLEIGADANLYRVGPDRLATDDALDVGGDLRTYGGLQVDGDIVNAVLTAALAARVVRPGQPRSGSRYAPVFTTFAPATVNLNEIRHVPIDIHGACTITELACEVTAAIANAKVRLLVAAANANGRPSGNFLYVSPQLDASAVGKVAATALTLAIPAAGRYFFAALPQVAVPTLRSVGQVVAMYEQPSMATYNRCCYSEYGVSGTPVTVGAVSLDAGDAPRVECLIA